MLDTMAEVMKEAYNRGWITTRDGNISLRRKTQDHLYITPTGVRKQNLTSEQIIKLHFPENRYEEDSWRHMIRADDEYQQRIIGLKPSGELPFHYNLLVNIPTSNRVVLHLHPTYTIAAMYAGYDIREIANQFAELKGQTVVGGMVPDIEARTVSLAKGITQTFDLKPDGSVNADIIGIHLHGVVAIDIDPIKCFGHVERLEHVCQIVLAAGGFRKQIKD